MLTASVIEIQLLCAVDQNIIRELEVVRCLYPRKYTIICCAIKYDSDIVATCTITNRQCI